MALLSNLEKNPQGQHGWQNSLQNLTHEFTQTDAKYTQV